MSKLTTVVNRSGKTQRTYTDKEDFFAMVLLIVGPRPYDYDTAYRDWCINNGPIPTPPECREALDSWCGEVEWLMASDAAQKVNWTHRLSSVPWRLRRGEFEQWLGRMQHERT
jgi:hypothetical protein